MAYIVSSPVPSADNRSFVVTIAGTALDGNSEAIISGVPTFGRIRRLKAIKGAGDASTLDPLLGTAADPSGASVVLENGTPAAVVDTQPEGLGAPYYSANGTLYYRGRPNSGSNNVETVELLISDGWE